MHFPKEFQQKEPATLHKQNDHLFLQMIEATYNNTVSFVPEPNSGQLPGSNWGIMPKEMDLETDSLPGLKSQPCP